MTKCIICSKDIQDNQKIRDSRTLGITYECDTCGRYKINRKTNDDLPSDKWLNECRYILSGLIRQKTEQGGELYFDDLKTMRSLVETAPIPKNPFEALNKLLLYIRSHITSFGGSYVVDSGLDYPITFSKNENEFNYILSKLKELGYIRSKTPDSNDYILTLKGWEKSEELMKLNPKSKQAFVAMWFSDDTKKAWEDGFLKAINSTGYKPIRVDLIEHNNKICDVIIAEIRRSGLLVADFTGNRGGVYFESGFAMGLGIPVIWTCLEDCVKELHFDTRQYNHIVWSDSDDLCKKLKNRIESTLPILTEKG